MVSLYNIKNLRANCFFLASHRPYLSSVFCSCGAYAFFPPVQSKIAPLISLTLHSQRRSSMVAPCGLAHRDSQTHPGLRIHFIPVRLHPILSSDIRKTLNLLIRVQRNHQQLLLPLLLILRIHC